MKYERIKDLRDENFWTQEYVAHELNITQRTYSHYESGTRSMPIDILIKLAGLYGVSVDYLLDRTNARKPYPKR